MGVYPFAVKKISIIKLPMTDVGKTWFQNFHGFSNRHLHTFFVVAQQPRWGLDLHIVEVSRPHSDTPHSDTPHSDTPHSDTPHSVRLY
jgi:hypothetical protein